MRTLRCVTGEDAIVDAKYYDYLNQFIWYCHRGRPTRTNADSLSSVTLYAEIAALANFPPCEVVDHKNRDPLDNRVKNLRPATYRQNAQNRSLRCDNTSGVTGVSRNSETQKWQPALRDGNRSIHLGHFDDISEAKEARDVGVLYFYDVDFATLHNDRSHYPPGHPDTWPAGVFSDIVFKCQQAKRVPLLSSNNLSGYTRVAYVRQSNNFIVNIKVGKKTIGLGRFEIEDLLVAVQVADIAAIHLGRDKINLGREHYPPGPPRDWPEHLVPNCPALRKLIGE
jgi:hypothetical protein